MLDYILNVIDSHPKSLKINHEALVLAQSLGIPASAFGAWWRAILAADAEIGPVE